VFRRPEEPTGLAAARTSERNRVVVAGPGSTTTIPGIIVSEIVQAISRRSPTLRVEVDLGLDFTVGLHRAPSLAIAHSDEANATVTVRRAPDSARFRAQAFREWMAEDVGTAIAYAWPGIDNSWIKQFLAVGRHFGATTIVAIASLPRNARTRAVALADAVGRADLVLVGDAEDARALSSSIGSSRTKVEVHPALSLSNRVWSAPRQQITAFLPRDSTRTLSTLLAAFDAIPEAWVHDYHLQVVMRHVGQILPEMVANSYHADHVRLIGEDLSSPTLEELCAGSSVLSVADPGFGSRAFSTAVDFGLATVVLSSSRLPEVGRGYVGGLLADLTHPASVHVALTHALRLAELRFPNPDAWDDLAARLTNTAQPSPVRLLEPTAPAG
jgi:hypothetical protein